MTVTSSSGEADYALASTGQFADSTLTADSVTSNTPNGSYLPGDIIDVRVNLSEDVVLETVQVVHGASGSDGREFRGIDTAWSVATAQVGSSHYALTDGIYGDIQVINITDPSAPASSSHILPGPVFNMSAVASIATAQVGSSHYALTASLLRGIQIINITDPSDPTAAAFVAGSDPYNFTRVRHVATAQVGSSHYALVSSDAGSRTGVHIIGIDDPGSPQLVSFVGNGSGYSFTNPLFATTTQVGSSHYALVASFDDDTVLIIDITDPASPEPAAHVRHGGDFAIDGPNSISAFSIGSSHYAAVAAWFSDSLQIINITDPTAPKAVARAVHDGGKYLLEGARSVQTIQAGDSHYALVAARASNALQIIDITDPGHPLPVTSVRYEKGVFDQMIQPLNVATANIGGSNYALVASLPTGPAGDRLGHSCRPCKPAPAISCHGRGPCCPARRVCRP